MWVKHKSISWDYYLFYDITTKNTWLIHQNPLKNLLFEKGVWPLNQIINNIEWNCWIEVQPTQWAIDSLNTSIEVDEVEEYLQEQIRVLDISREQFLKQCIRVYQLYQAGELIRLPETLHKRSLI